MMEFKKYVPTQQVEHGTDVYADVVNHCKSYRAYVVGGSITSSVHEITHCINSDLRNGALMYSGQALYHDPNYGYSEKIIPQIVNQQLQCRCYERKNITGDRQNALYVLKDRAIKINEPNTRKKDCIPFIPSIMRFYRYGTYVTGQQAWDDSPLYLFDEWIAYSNGADSVIDQSKQNKYKDGASDYIFGPIEFVAYGVGTLMAAAKNAELDETLKWFSQWQLRRVFNLYFEGIKYLPWVEADKCYGLLKSGSECQDMRTFMEQKLQFKIPDAFVPPDAPEPEPTLDWIM